MFVFPSGGMFRLKIDRSPRIIRSNSMLLFPHFIETGLTKATSLHSPLSGPGSQLVSSCLVREVRD
ncbi:no significant blast hit [Histoplasma capsulatum var. duboisii H88]|uniref:No significant blast hit n=1 Tax=Ajellomyces capsulatus (strain H88) TaxID=544711 RepID=A0A8A1LUU5_AJEC8|nr:no significant blast hit [Histoplasma capsulatum var. duboisii H88]